MARLPQLAHEPVTAESVTDQTLRLHSESVAYWDRYGDADFFAPMGSHWSAADHVRHLTRSIRAVTVAFRLPRWLLRLRFGAARAPSRTFAALRDDYHAALAGGGKAGRYGPSPLPEAERTHANRLRLMDFHAAAVRAFADALARWPDAKLDGARVPHPLLGMLTLRELAYFTLYHNLHHVEVAERRRLESGPRLD